MQATIKENWLQKEFGKEAIEIVAKYAPVLTPLAPAAVSVAGMTAGLTSAYGSWAFLPALGSGLGMESTGYMASHLLIRAIRRGDFMSGLFSLIFLAGYAGFAIMAMAHIPNAGMFQFFVAMSVVTFLCVGQYTYDNKLSTATSDKRKREIEEKHAALEVERAESALQIEREKARAEIEMMKAQAETEKMKLQTEIEHQRTLQANALARQAKSEHGNFVQSVHRTSVQTLDAEKLEITRRMVAENQNVTTREIAAALGFTSPSSGKTYKDAVTK